ncbi:MAG: hypothetical protein AVDCRST_MAG36-512 [uncultured Nocardioidaceae bacterium]|uniref:DUF58 domain-containing protein n=1 Tax=uncultured Nocardioidaceae bacterium TaxID=253824 RepID=A0A6J4L2R3_9ACTN|nr:MAG: hypothetical protein AVDCRST_MAG36-512 [uncultured Nocardioidaceae bacterium]
MTEWRPTPSLLRAVLLALAGLAGALLTGSPSLVVLASPFVLLAGAGVLAHPRTRPQCTSALDHDRLHEGQGTTSRLHLRDGAGVEQVTRVASPVPYVATLPASGVSGAATSDGLPALEYGPRRWGRRDLGVERVALTSGWAGWRWGPVDLPFRQLHVLPQTAPFDARSEVPQPDGLVGAHRARRPGSGTELEGIRPFAAGDRLRRISWPVTLRTGEVHAVTTRAEQDAGVWLVLDALREIGWSGGIDGEASSLDLTVRAGSALAAHHLRQGDRVGLLVLGAEVTRVPLGSGPRHLHRIEGTLVRVRADPRRTPPERLELGAAAGSIVHVLSPMLQASVVTAAATLQRRGLSVVVIDTLGHHEPAEDRLSTAGLAWRMRMVEREDRLDALATLGCPVVRWQGPGTLDEVLQRLARRARVPRVGAR